MDNTQPAPSYNPSSCCGAHCFRYKGYPDEPCWGEVEVIEEEMDGDDWWWIHACQGHLDCYCNPDGKYRPEPTPNGESSDGATHQKGQTT
jgi:hypothetical protein